jgi:hypothetical protein
MITTKMTTMEFKFHMCGFSDSDRVILHWRYDLFANDDG